MIYDYCSGRKDIINRMSTVVCDRTSSTWKVCAIREFQRRRRNNDLPGTRAHRKSLGHWTILVCRKI
jgi:hypothetical protein